MVSLLAVVIDLATLASIVSFGALVAFSAVNLSVIKHYFVDRAERGGWGVFNNLILPFIGFAFTVDQPVRANPGDRIVLAGSRIRVACRRHPRLPTSYTCPRTRGVAPQFGQYTASRTAPRGSSATDSDRGDWVSVTETAGPSNDFAIRL